MLLTATRTSARCQSAKRIEFRGQDAIPRTRYTVGIFKKIFCHFAFKTFVCLFVCNRRDTYYSIVVVPNS